MPHRGTPPNGHVARIVALALAASCLGAVAGLTAITLSDREIPPVLSYIAVAVYSSLTTWCAAVMGTRHLPPPPAEQPPSQSPRPGL